jgi:hypothetical protein
MSIHSGRDGSANGMTELTACTIPMAMCEEVCVEDEGLQCGDVKQ